MRFVSQCLSTVTCVVTCSKDCFIYSLYEMICRSIWVCLHEIMAYVSAFRNKGPACTMLQKGHFPSWITSWLLFSCPFYWLGILYWYSILLLSLVSCCTQESAWECGECIIVGQRVHDYKLDSQIRYDGRLFHQHTTNNWFYHFNSTRNRSSTCSCWRWC